MTMRPSVFRPDAWRRVVAALTAFAMIAPLASPALAWKPKTHVYLAEIAMRDAVDDGMVTIYQTDYATGRVLGPLGHFEANPAIVAALRAKPAQYLAGVVGPDAYPDLMTGQQVIHPGTNLSLLGDPAHNEPSSVAGSDAWLTYLWRLAYGRVDPNLQQLREALNRGPMRLMSPATDTPEVRAFVAGYMTHAAGDMFMHTFVNHYAGGDFAIQPDPRNALKHVVLEGYVGKRTPDTHARTSIEGVEDFIYRYMVRASPGSILEERLLQGGGTTASLPAIFSKLRNGLQRDVDEYDRERLSRSGPARVAYAAANGPAAEYKKAWIEDIDEGLRAWPATSHQISLALVYDPNGGGADVGAAKAIASEYMKDHLLSMAGAPDAVIATVRFIAGVIDAILPDIMLAPLEALKQNLLDWLCRQATGMSVDELKAYLDNPETTFDRVMNQPGGGYGGGRETLTTLASFNRDVLRIDDPGAQNMSRRFVVDQFAPAFNTVQMTKLMFLSEKGMNDLLAALRAKGLSVPAAPAVPGHYESAMLGFLTSMDGDNRWQGPTAGAQGRPFFLATGSADGWRNLFMRQIGEGDWVGSAAATAPIGAPDDANFQTIGFWGARVDDAKYDGGAGRNVAVTMTFRNDTTEDLSFSDVLIKPVRSMLGLGDTQTTPQVRMEYVHAEGADLPPWHYVKSTPIPPKGRIQVRFVFEVGDTTRQGRVDRITLYEQRPKPGGVLTRLQTIDGPSKTFPVPRMEGAPAGSDVTTPATGSSPPGSIASGAATAAFTPGPYLSYRADAMARPAPNQVAVMLSVLNSSSGLKRVHNAVHTLWLVGADGTEYRADGNIYVETTAQPLHTGLSMEKNEMVHISHLFNGVPATFTPLRLSFRENGKETISLTLSNLPTARPSGSGDGSQWMGADPANPGPGRFNASIGEFRRAADGTWEAILSVSVKGQTPQRFVTNDFEVALYGADGQVRRRDGNLYRPDGGDVRYAIGTVTVQPGETVKVKVVFPTSAGMNPQRYRLEEAYGPAVTGPVSATP